MNAREAGELLALMKATWQGMAVDDVSARLWLDDLMTRCERAPAVDAFRALRDSEDRPPVWSTFLAAYRNVVQLPKYAPPAIEAAPTEHADPLRLAALLEEARAALTRE